MVCCAVLPGYVPELGGVNLSSVYSDGLQLGWNVNSTDNITLQEVPIGINGSLAMCANMPAFEVCRQQPVILSVLRCITCREAWCVRVTHKDTDLFQATHHRHA